MSVNRIWNLTLTCLKYLEITLKFGALPTVGFFCQSSGNGPLGPTRPVGHAEYNIYILVGGLEHFLFFHILIYIYIYILGTIIPTD